MPIKAIIFDWGRTLYDPENKVLYPDVKCILEILAKYYKLGIISLASDGKIERRLNLIKTFGLAELFSVIKIAKEDKDSLYEQAFSELKVLPKETMIVDDRVIRGIRYGNSKGAITVWIQQGLFASELPNQITD